jgi:rhomboid protease GluP
LDPVVQRLLQVVHLLVVGERAMGKLLGFGDVLALVELRPDRVVVVMSAAVGPERLREKRDEILERARGMHVDLVMVGGSEEARSLVESAQPRFMLRRVIRAYHLDDAGELWVGRSTRRDSAVGDALTAVARGEGPDALALGQLEQHVVVPSEDDRAAAREHEEFVGRFRARRPFATWTLLVSIAIVFGLQALWGGTQFIPTLVRMGANTPAALEDQPWRLLSSAFLHAGPWHILINAYVLYALGGFVERVLGWPRFVLLYASAALGGGIASAALLGAGISVGASGAIWGLFGAAAALAWRPGGVLPARLLPRMRRITLVNLVINLTVSFLPQVDLMAHLGGGIVGAGLVASGVLTRGLPSIESPLDDDGPRDAGPMLSWSAAFVAVVLYGSLVVGWLVDRPWALVAEPRWTQTVLEPDVPIELPDALGPPTRANGRPGEIVWHVGDLGRDPMQLAVGITPAIELEGEAAMQGAVAALRERALAAPAGAEPLGERLTPDAPGVAWEERFHYPGQARAAYRLVRLTHAEVFVELEWWHDAPGPWPDQVVERVLDSLRADRLVEP